MKKTALAIIALLFILACKNNNKNTSDTSFNGETRNDFVPETEKPEAPGNCPEEGIIHFKYLFEHRFDYKPEADSKETSSIARKMEKTKVSICNDTLIINDKYKTSFVRKKWSFERFFGKDAGSWVEEKLSERFKEKKIDLKKDSISFLLIDLPIYPDFSFSDYSMWGTVIYNQGYLCLIYNEKVIGWFRDDKVYINEHNSNKLPFDYLHYVKNDYETGGENYHFPDIHNEKNLKQLFANRLKENSEDIGATLCFYLPNHKFNILVSGRTNMEKILTVEKTTDKIIDYVDIDMSYNEFWQEKNFSISKDLVITVYKNETGKTIKLENEAYDETPEFREILKSMPFERHQIQDDGQIVKTDPR